MKIVTKKTSNATQEEEEDLVAVVAKHTSEQEAVAAMFVILDVEISTLHSTFGALSKSQPQVALSKPQPQMDTVRAVEGKFFATAKSRPGACSAIGVGWDALGRRTSTLISIGRRLSGHDWQIATEMVKGDSAG